MLLQINGNVTVRMLKLSRLFGNLAFDTIGPFDFVFRCRGLSTAIKSPARVWSVELHMKLEVTYVQWCV